MTKHALTLLALLLARSVTACATDAPLSDAAVTDSGSIISDSAQSDSTPDASISCRTNDDCPNPQRPLCNNAHVCSTCVSNEACSRFASTPACGPDGGCVECTGDTEDKCTSAGQVCQTNGTTCTGCNENADCADPGEPICEAGTCRGCTGEADCAAAGKLCHESTGECVECEPSKDDPTAEGCANGNACDPSALTCTGAPRGTLSGCAKCVSDNECVASTRCVRTKFTNADYGTYCLEQKDTGACPNQYAAKRTATSTLGTEASYCFPDDTYTTCEAILDYKSICVEDDDCGAEGVSDGLCRADRCTYGCNSESDCDGPASPPAPPSCIGVGGAKYCNPN